MPPINSLLIGVPHSQVIVGDTIEVLGEVIALPARTTILSYQTEIATTTTESTIQAAVSINASGPFVVVSTASNTEGELILLDPVSARFIQFSSINDEGADATVTVLAKVANP